MPVGQAVTATRLFGPAAAAGAGGSATAVAVPAGAAAAEEAAAAAAAAGAAAGAGAASPTTSLTSRTTSSGSSAARRASVNSAFTSARASFVSTLRWVASPPAGAAMRNARSAGPSLAPNSTGGESRANARVGSSTAAVRQWGMAMPPGSPVGEVDSRASASSTSVAGSAVRPASPTMPASWRITSVLSAPRAASRRTRSRVIISVMVQLQKGG